MKKYIEIFLSTTIEFLERLLGRVQSSENKSVGWSYSEAKKKELFINLSMLDEEIQVYNNIIVHDSTTYTYEGLVGVVRLTGRNKSEIDRYFRHNNPINRRRGHGETY